MESIKNIFRIVALLLVTSVVACLLFPVVWSVLGGVIDYPPDRVFRRIWMLTVIIGLLGWGKEIGLQSPDKVGFTLSRAGYWNGLIGIAVSCVFLSALTALYFYLDFWRLRDPINPFEVLRHIVEAPFKGALIAGIEEYIFRGLIFLSLARRWGWIPAAVFSSVIFSSLHFIEGKNAAHAGDADSWYTGFIICGEMLENMVSRIQIFPSATGLFLVGLIMCFATIRTGNLWYAAGMHGGWICFFVICKTMVDYTSTNPILTGGGRLFDGVIPIAGMLVIFPVTYWLIQKNILKKSEEPPV